MIHGHSCEKGIACFAVFDAQNVNHGENNIIIMKNFKTSLRVTKTDFGMSFKVMFYIANYQKHVFEERICVEL